MGSLGCGAQTQTQWYGTINKAFVEGVSYAITPRGVASTKTAQDHSQNKG